MKFVAAARSSLGIPTVFNLLGPLTNPAGARHQLLGVFSPELTDRLAAVASRTGQRAGLGGPCRRWTGRAVHPRSHPRQRARRMGMCRTFVVDPGSLGLAYARLSDLQVETADESANAIRLMAQGRPGPVRDISVLNAAAALVVAEKVGDLSEGVVEAGEAIDDGRLEHTLAVLAHCSDPKSQI